MIIILTVGELMMHTNWSVDDVKDFDCPLLMKLMGWCRSRIDTDNLSERAIFQAQYVALPENVARRLGIIGEESNQKRQAMRKLKKSGNHILTARVAAPASVDNLKIRERYAVTNVYLEYGGKVIDDMPF